MMPTAQGQIALYRQTPPGGHCRHHASCTGQRRSSSGRGSSSLSRTRTARLQRGSSGVPTAWAARRPSSAACVSQTISRASRGVAGEAHLMQVTACIPCSGRQLASVCQLVSPVGNSRRQVLAACAPHPTPCSPSKHHQLAPAQVLRQQAPQQPRFPAALWAMLAPAPPCTTMSCTATLVVRLASSSRHSSSSAGRNLWLSNSHCNSSMLRAIRWSRPSR